MKLGEYAQVTVAAPADVEQGRLVRLLPDWRLPTVGLHTVHPPGRHISAAARAFVERYRERWIG